MLGIMDQYDSKINHVKYMWVSTYISWSIDFALYHCHRLKLFLYIKKWRRPRVFIRGETIHRNYGASRFSGHHSVHDSFSPCFDTVRFTQV